MGTGGPFGAEGPIIATGGALGSLLGQFIRTTPVERKTLLAVGAAAGMAAIFGCPVAAVLLSIELLLFEYRPRSIIPVALGAATAAGIRVIFEGSDPVFKMPPIEAPHLMAMAFYILLGAVMGVAAAAVTRIVCAVEDAFERLPIHWMWWPAIGAVAVGVIGYFQPYTLGVGYSNVSAIISNSVADSVCRRFVLCEIRFLVDCAWQRNFRRHDGALVHRGRRFGASAGRLGGGACAGGRHRSENCGAGGHGDDRSSAINGPARQTTPSR